MVQSAISRADFEWKEGNRKRGSQRSALHGDLIALTKICEKRRRDFLEKRNQKREKQPDPDCFSDGTDAFSICTVPAVWHGADGAGGRDDRIE